MGKRDDRKIRQMRIDVPLRSTYAYLFVDEPPHDWDPWWNGLYNYLLGFGARELDWKYEPVQEVYIARPTLSAGERRDLMRFLRTAPPHEVDTHRTLRRAVELAPEREVDVQLVYFSAATRDAPSSLT